MPLSFSSVLFTISQDCPESWDDIPNKLKVISLWQIFSEVVSWDVSVIVHYPENILFTETWYTIKDMNSVYRFIEVNRTRYVAIIYLCFIICVK